MRHSHECHFQEDRVELLKNNSFVTLASTQAVLPSSQRGKEYQMLERPNAKVEKAHLIQLQFLNPALGFRMIA